jgi:hypothetical protein
MTWAEITLVVIAGLMIALGCACLWLRVDRDREFRRLRGGVSPRRLGRRRDR